MITQRTKSTEICHATSEGGRRGRALRIIVRLSVAITIPWGKLALSCFGIFHKCYKLLQVIRSDNSAEISLRRCWYLHSLEMKTFFTRLCKQIHRERLTHFAFQRENSLSHERLMIFSV